ncbi:ABC-2 type transport system ATP-binding protein [Catenulispora sp. EB89]|uniref:ABC transporter ATP-binding protein n=1 Tax=Catenulispora sp. EB89 TaxID=3156257 RepID=UPI00351580BA
MTATKEDPVLVVDKLTKKFGSRTAYSDVSFTVGRGEVFGFLGPNGAGKTTTVRSLGTLITPTSGRATVAGIPLEAANAVEIRERIAIMTEAPGLYGRLSVTENLQYFVGLYHLSDGERRIKRALEAVNLTDRAQDTCNSLSKGLRQRVGLARTLLNDPEILFLDEPTSGLDPVAARGVHDLISGLRDRGVTIFFTTHRLAEAEALCDRVAILNTTLRSIGKPSELREQLFHKGLIVATAAPLADPGQVFAGLPGVESWDTDAGAGTAGAGAYRLAVSDPAVAAPEVVRALVHAQADVLSVSESRHSLEDVYLELVNEDVEATQR